MTHAALAPLIGPEFDKFLYASIGEGRNGTMLSVLSALARLDVDPWREAASLARMPKEAATERLTALIAALPDEPTMDIPAKSVAADLAALLPRVGNLNAPSLNSVFAAVDPQRTQIRMALSVLAILIFVVFALSASLSPRPGDGAKPSAPSADAAATVSPRKLDP
jgi:hypothetical protein